MNSFTFSSILRAAALHLARNKSLRIRDGVLGIRNAQEDNCIRRDQIHQTALIPNAGHAYFLQ